jgi:HEAT repeat protein
MAYSNNSSPDLNNINIPTTSDTTPSTPPAQDVTPPVGITPPQVLAQEAAAGRRGAAWRLMHWIMEDDPRAILAVASLDDDRLARHFLEFLALGTWAGKPFAVPSTLRSGHFKTRLRTLFLPGSGMDPFRTEQVLVSAAHDKRAPVRETAMYILGLLGSRVATPVLIQSLNDPVPGVRLQAAKALGRTHDPAAVPALLGALHTADEQLATQVFQALVNLGTLAVPALLKESTSSSGWVRWYCIRALGGICDHRALPVLVHALTDTDHSVAWMAAKSLVRFGKECLVPVLRLLITVETSPWLVETAWYVLRDLCLHDTKLKPYLEPVLQDMHGVAYRIATPNAASKALASLVADGVVTA